MTEKKEEKKPIDWKIVIAAIASLTIIEVIALLKGMNGTFMAVIIGAVAALAGLSLPQLKLRSH